VEILGGRTLTDAAVKAAIDRGERYDGIAIGPDLNLSIEPADWPGIHGNHSCDPTLWMADAIRVVVRRPVAVGDELTVDYALFSATPWWPMLCNCGAPNCRGVVSGEDWRRPELQARYAGHFSPHQREDPWFFRLNRQLVQLPNSRGEVATRELLQGH
jgi:uncharacterized protein